MSLEVKGLYKEYDNKIIYSDFSLILNEGTITCILGPSGCGKTTLLNLMGNIVSPDKGTLYGFEGKTMSYIFQDPRLIPWMTVEGNIDFVLSRHLTREIRKEIAERVIRLVELEGFENYYPSKLSGGMRQRVAIARAFAYPSDIILMDEPLKGLDVKLKQNLIKIFSNLWKNDKRTVVYVTHDVDEALLLGNEVIVLGSAPANIVASRKIEPGLDERIIDSEYFRNIKSGLLSALGN